MMALTLDATAARRVATENNFITALYGGGLDEMREGERGLRSCLEGSGSIYLTTNPSHSMSEVILMAETPDTHHL